jgi:hypothetical protein
MIFPELGPQYLNEPHRDLIARMEAFYAQSITINQQFWGEADTDTRFYSNDQTLWNDLYGNLPVNRRRSFAFNRIKRAVDMVYGYQCRNRKSTIVVPVKNGVEHTADQWTKLMLWHDREEGVLETISRAFLGALVTGMNLLEVWVDYREDPINGKIKVDVCSYNDFTIDPYFRNPDLSDCVGAWRRKYLTKREVVSLFPDRVDEVMALYGRDNRDGKFQFQPESYNYGLKDLLSYDTFYYRDFRKQKMLVDTKTGETKEWKSSDNEQLKLFLSRYPEITVIEQEIPTVKTGIMVQGKVFYDGPQFTGTDRYCIIPVMAYYMPQLPYFPFRIEGMVRGLRDAQYLYNRRRIIELDILESQIASGWKYKENALVNPKDIFMQGQGRGLALKEEAQMTDVEQILPPAIPDSMIRLSELLAQEITQISGVNEELLGSAVDDKAGVLSMLRQGAGLTTLQMLFDNLDFAQKQLGRVRMDIMQANWTPGHIQAILGEQPSEFFYKKEFGTYDAAVEEGLNTITQKQMQFAQMIQLRELGVPITNEDLLQAATLQGKKELIENMQKQQQQQMQMAQQAQEVQIQEAQSRIKLAEARAVADQGLGLERISRVEENEALATERIAQAERDHEAALLDKVKALKELEGLDLSHIRHAIELAGMLQQQSHMAVKNEQMTPRS